MLDKENYNEIMDAPKTPNDVFIVYFAFLNPDRWETIVTGQMIDLKDYGLLQEGAHLHIVLCSDNDKDLTLKCQSKILEILPNHENIEFTLVYNNTFEYPGFDVLYRDALAHPDKIFLYFHSKGMVYYDTNQRLPLEKILTEKTIKNWRHVLDIFNKNASVSKVCFTPSDRGFCWYNFFWVRGTYLNACSKPYISTDRYVYESYLGDQCKVVKADMYSLIDDKIDIKYNNPAVVKRMSKFTRQ